MTDTSTTKSILVTGGNTGIGFALCRQLVADHSCKVYMGARNAERGQKAVEEIKAKHPDKAENIELVLMDVSADVSVEEAAADMKNKNVSLYAIVNNAGVGLKTGSGNEDELLATNFYGPKRVTDAFAGMVIEDGGRIVNVSSGAASMYLREKSLSVKKLFTNTETTWDELVAEVEEKKSGGGAGLGIYGLSKAALNLLTIQQSLIYPQFKCASLSPGFIETNMTAGWGAKLTPEQGTVSYIKCLFGDVISGCYYGSDGLRSPLTMTRDPGTPEYEGEDEDTIDRSKYNR